MKNKQKLLLIVLSLAFVCITILAFGACNNTTQNKEQQIVETLRFQKIEGKEEYRVMGIGTVSELDIVIPSTYKGFPVTEIGNNAFRDESYITSVTIPNSVTSIGNYAFYYCSSLTSVVIPNSVTSIGNSAFRICSSLTSVELPNSVTSIGSSAFEACSSLTLVNYTGTIDEWAQINFDSSYANPLSFAKSLKINGEVVTEVNLTTATKISSFVFYNCSELTSVIIGDSVTSIGNSAFSGCSSLTSVELPNSVTSIGSRAFSDCSSLTSIKYRGTQEDWNKISRDISWNDGTYSYTITYNYTGE